MKKEKRSLKELRERIEDERVDVGVKPYSHNIIGLLLGEIAENYGAEYANAAIEDFDLEELGWIRGDKP